MANLGCFAIDGPASLAELSHVPASSEAGKQGKAIERGYPHYPLGFPQIKKIKSRPPLVK